MSDEKNETMGESQDARRHDENAEHHPATEAPAEVKPEVAAEVAAAEGAAKPAAVPIRPTEIITGASARR